MKLASRFIPATAEIWSMQTGNDAEARLYQKFMKQGFTEGMPNTHWQGCYVVAPSGYLLAYLHVTEYSDGAPKPGALVKLMEDGLAKWKSLPREDRLLPHHPRQEQAEVRNAERFYPQDGLVLHEYACDLPHEHPAEYAREKVWRERPASQWNQDFVWFTKSEAAKFLPPRLQKGEAHDVPSALVQRLVCIHLVEYRRRQGFEPRDVQRARLTAEVTAVDGAMVRLRLEGSTRAVAERPGVTGSRGIATRLLGKATYDRAKQRFLRFDLVAVGTRWLPKGQDPLFDPGPAPTGFLFTLAGKDPTERLAPAGFHRYEWAK